MINQVINLFNFDSLALLMLFLVGFIGIIVASFARKYMKGDSQYRKFFTLLGLLFISVMIMVCADNIFLLAASWGLNNALLVQMMIHKSKWRAAKASGGLAADNYLYGYIFIICGFMMLYSHSGTASIVKIIELPSNSPLMIGALILLLFGALTQSAIWPFHKWLLSSLNSPTPISAMMHAGLINGGGFLLVRFAPLYLANPLILDIIFAIGLLSAIIGTFWKLMQSDIKRMLACSTMGQMGFMLAQCGLGLFPAAITHLFWHGMYKAYLFLASGGVTQEKRLNLSYPPSIISFIAALICGALGAYSFIYASNLVFTWHDTTLVLVMIALIICCQFSLPILYKKTLARLLIAAIASVIVGFVYGSNVYLIENLLGKMNLMQPQPLNGLHITGIILLGACWLTMLMWHKQNGRKQLPDWVMKLYVKSLNASQPHPETITAHRGDYKYL